MHTFSKPSFSTLSNSIQNAFGRRWRALVKASSLTTVGSSCRGSCLDQGRLLRYRISYSTCDAISAVGLGVERPIAVCPNPCWSASSFKVMHKTLEKSLFGKQAARMPSQTRLAACKGDFPIVISALRAASSRTSVVRCLPSSPRILLTNLVPNLTSVFVHEHERALLTKVFWLNKLGQKGLSLVKSRLVPLGSPRWDDDWLARMRLTPSAVSAGLAPVGRRLIG